MVEALQPLKPLDGVEQAAFYHSRERTRSLRDVAAGLYRNISVPPNAGAFLAASIGGRARPITVTAVVEVTGAASGIVWEVGSATRGLGLSFDGAVLTAAAGDGAGSGGVSTTLAGLSVGERVQVAVAVNPGTRKLAIYINGQIEARAVGAAEFTAGEFADGGGGGIASANGSVTPRLGTSAALTGASLVSPVSLYLGQLPRGFEA